MQALALPDEERDADIVLELADARRDVGLDAMQTLSGPRDAALTNHGAEYLQIGQIHASLHGIIIILIIHFI